MTDDNFDLTRRKVLGSLGAVGVGAAAAGAGTTALFSDTEESTDNSFEAGELDLYVHYEFTANQGGAEDLETPKSGVIQSDEDMDTGASVNYVLSDVKPGDSGSLEFCFSIVDNPAYLWMYGGLTADDENGTTESEGATPWERDGGPSGELATYTRAQLYYETGSDDTLITEGSLRGVLADLDAGLPLQGNGDPAAGVIDRPSFEGSSDSSETADTCVRLDWQVPLWIGNEVQTDSLEFDLSFYAEQARHNDGSAGWTVVQPGDDLQAAINDAASGDTLLLAEGTHDDGVTVEKTVNIRGEGSGLTEYAPGTDTGMDVRAGGIRIGDMTVTNAQQGVDVNGEETESGRVSDVMLSNIVATGNSGRALVLDYTDNAIVRDIETTNNGNDGLTLWYSNDSHVETVVATDNADNGIYFNGDNNVLLDSTAKRNGDEGVDVNWYDDLASDQQRVTLDDVVAMDNVEEDIELHDNGTDNTVADDSMLLRKVETGGAPEGLRLAQVDSSEIRTERSSFPNGTVDGSGTDVDP